MPLSSVFLFGLLLLPGCRASEHATEPQRGQSDKQAELYARFEEMYAQLAKHASGTWTAVPQLTGTKRWMEETGPPVRISISFSSFVPLPADGPLEGRWPVGTVTITTPSERYEAHVHTLAEHGDDPERFLFLGPHGYSLSADESTVRPITIGDAPGWVIRWFGDGREFPIYVTRLSQEVLKQIPVAFADYPQGEEDAVPQALSIDWGSFHEFEWRCKRPND